MASAPKRVVGAFLCSSRSGEEMEDRFVSAESSDGAPTWSWSAETTSGMG